MGGSLRGIQRVKDKLEAFKLTFNASDVDCFRTECKGDTVRHFKTLVFYSADEYIVQELLGDLKDG